MPGGVSAQVTALEIERVDGQTQRMIVRRHGSIDLQHNPHIAADEFRLLQRLHSAGLAVPEPYFFDQSNEIFPSPYIVLEYIDGETVFAPLSLEDYLVQVATQLSKIHSLRDWLVDLSFLPDQTTIYQQKLHPRPTKLDDSLQEGQIRDVLEDVGQLAQRNQPTLLHGDYWSGNILWRDHQLIAVIDWEDARIGDPLADLAVTRLEMLWAFGIDAMHRFTDLYRTMTSLDFNNLPYWDLYAALRPAFKIADWASDPAAELAMREKHRSFVVQAFDQLK
ncbi:MAG: phosphotransferase [Anaerolineae bacterium]|nr:phosphotransferase [Anaerolineae bacterium]